MRAELPGGPAVRPSSSRFAGQSGRPAERALCRGARPVRNNVRSEPNPLRGEGTSFETKDLSPPTQPIGSSLGNDLVTRISAHISASLGVLSRHCLCILFSFRISASIAFAYQCASFCGISQVWGLMNKKSGDGRWPARSLEKPRTKYCFERRELSSWDRPEAEKRHFRRECNYC